jgi:hypothetical protein
MEVLWSGLWPNKHMVPTLPARGSLYIRTRHKGLGSGVGFVLPVKARVGRTFEALGLLAAANKAFQVCHLFKDTFDPVILPTRRA